MDELTEKPKELIEEAGRGRSERTPWIALGGVTLVVSLILAVVLAIALIAYFLS